MGIMWVNVRFRSQIKGMPLGTTLLILEFWVKSWKIYSQLIFVKAVSYKLTHMHS